MLYTLPQDLAFLIGSSDVRSGDVATTKGIERNPVIGDLAISIDRLLVQILAMYK